MRDIVKSYKIFIKYEESDSNENLISAFNLNIKQLNIKFCNDSLMDFENEGIKIGPTINRSKNIDFLKTL